MQPLTFWLQKYNLARIGQGPPDSQIWWSYLYLVSWVIVPIKHLPCDLDLWYFASKSIPLPEYFKIHLYAKFNAPSFICYWVIVRNNKNRLQQSFYSLPSTWKQNWVYVQSPNRCRYEHSTLVYILYLDCMPFYTSIPTILYILGNVFSTCLSMCRLPGIMQAILSPLWH